MNNIYHRVSIRKYKDYPVEKDKLLQILKAGMQAPNACNQQPWEFYVVTDKETIPKAVANHTLRGMCGKSAGNHRSRLSNRRSSGFTNGSDRHGNGAGKYLVGDRCTRPRRCLHRDISHSGMDGSGPSDFGYYGKLVCFFTVCARIPGRGTDTAGSL